MVGDWCGQVRDRLDREVAQERFLAQKYPEALSSHFRIDAIREEAYANQHIRQLLVTQLPVLHIVPNARDTQCH